MKKFLSIFVIILALLGGCAKKHIPGHRDDAASQATIKDIETFPQDLEIYARAYGQNKRLLDQETQNILSSSFDKIYFGPWQMAKTSISRKSVAPLFNKARGFKDASTRWTQAEWQAMQANAALGQFPSMASHAITLRNTDLRELPTHQARFSEPTPNIKENPFDYFQYSILPTGTPLLLAHATADRKWYYVECPIAGGWVDARDIGLVDADFKREWRNGAFAALIKDKVNLPGTGLNGKDGKTGIGALLPMRGKGADGGFKVLVPVGGRHGFAEIAEVGLKPGDAAQRPLPLTPGNVAKVGNIMMGQSYGWGGTLGDRDCSALMRDLFTPFGLWLPRNSASQAKRGQVVNLEGMDVTAKAETIMRYGVPFLSLAGMRGHITLYVGKWNGKPAIFHNVWGLRVVRDGNDNDRHVIGKAVVTSITPGMELEDLYRPVTFVDRLRTLTRLGTR